VPLGGPDSEPPGTRQRRIQWLGRLAGLHRAYFSACEEEARLQALLRRLQDSKERPSTLEGHVVRTAVERDLSNPSFRVAHPATPIRGC
jgi:hypothetical protein